MSAIIDALKRTLALARCTLPHRIIRSATYEGMADERGAPLPALTALYRALVKEMPGTIITGFCAVSREGRAMHPRQTAIWDDSYIASWRDVTAGVHAASPGTKLFMQLAHCGRQTLARRTGLTVKGASDKRCTYFRQRVSALREDEALTVVSDFASAARRAQEAGFDGVQLHAAHGYLIHQFLSPHTNTRPDAFGDKGLFLSLAVRAVRDACGPDFPILLKVSWADDRQLRPEGLIPALLAVEDELDAVEISYGTMEYALNIFRGACPVEAALSVNPLFSSIPSPLRSLWKLFALPVLRRRFLPFSPCYNAAGASLLQDALSVPVIPVGGIHSLEQMRVCLEDFAFPAVSLCRPFICEPNLTARISRGEWIESACTVCNLCAIHCDADIPLRCHRGKFLHGETHEV